MTGGFAELAAARTRVSLNTFRSLRKQSTLKIATIVFFAVLLWVGFFWLFLDGFRFFGDDDLRDFRIILVDILFAIFFFSLFVLLLFSNGIIAYGSLFRSRESAFLFAHPVPAPSVYAYKLSETLMFSSWAFLFLALPLIVAFGVDVKAPWYYYPGAALFFGVFAALPAALGGAFVLVIARFFTRSVKRVLAWCIVLALTVALVWGLGLFRTYQASVSNGDTGWMRKVLGQLTLSQSPLLPSYWISAGLQNLAAGELRDATYRFLLLSSTAMFLGMAGIHVAGVLYAPGYHATQARTRRRRGRIEGRFFRGLERSLFFVKPELRILIVKDVKNFVRDPVQWSQVLVFFGLLGVYFVNMRNVQGEVDSPFWNNLINVLNLVATSLTLSTFTSRFIFPLVSLEGKRFWVLKLLPIEKKNIVYSKFWFAFVGSFVISQGLILLSDAILGVAPAVMALHALTMLIICAGLSGLSAGIGAIYPNLRETNPSKIVSGFGGTLNLIFSLLFVTLVVIFMTLPYHLVAMGRGSTAEYLEGFIVLGCVLGAVLGAIATVVPLALGVKAFERLEA